MEKPKNFTEWYVKHMRTEGLDFSPEEAKKRIRSLFELLLSENGVHDGDCTKQCHTCYLCELQETLDDYYEYTKTFNK
jgi:hypothetical protein